MVPTSDPRDPYCYPGTDVLINRFGITDGAKLASTEFEIVRHRLTTLQANLDLSAAGYRAIHRHLFEPIYEWAGEFRTIPLLLGNSLFALPRFIGPEIEKRMAAMAGESWRKRARRAIAERLAFHAIELNAIHPFRDGNGRTLRAFLRNLARQLDLNFDIAAIRPSDWNRASRAGFERMDAGPMMRILEAALKPGAGA